MAIVLKETKGVLRQFRRTVSQFKHQRTFQRLSIGIRPFSAAILSALKPVKTGWVILDEIVFEPKNLNGLFAKYAISTMPMINTRYLTDWSVRSEGDEEAEELLQAALGDSIDFAFVPDPKRFVIYADHDEYVTFLSATKSHLNKVISILEKSGFESNDYERRF